MATYPLLNTYRGLSLASLTFGILGVLFFWWAPFGIVLSLAGLVLGVVGWIMSGRRFRGRPLLISGTLVSLAGLVLGLVIACQNLEWIRVSVLH